MAGLTTTGFTAPTLAEIKTELEDALKALLGTSINLLPTSVFGAWVNALAERYLELWEAALDLYNGMDPDTADGVLLSYILALQGLSKLAATPSTVTLTVNLDATTTLLTGRLVSNPTTGVQFTTIEDVTSTTAGNYSVDAESVNTGPVAALAGSLTQIDTPVAGWNSVTNVLDAVPGTNVETDAEARQRRVEELAVQGSTTPDAIRSDTVDLSSVSSVTLLENQTDTTDGNGLPPHSFEVIVDDDGSLTDNQIAQAVWDDSKAAGIATFGSDSGTAVDSEGNNQTVNFTHVAQLATYVEVDYLTDGDYPVDGDDQVKAAIAGYDSSLGAGETLYAAKIYDLVFNVAGVVNITDVQVGTSAPASGSSVTPTIRQKVDLDTSRVVVNVT